MPSLPYFISLGFLLGTTLSTASFAVLSHDKDDTEKEQNDNKRRIKKHFNTLSISTIDRVIETGKGFLYSEYNPDLYNITVVKTASQMQDAGGIFVEGLMREYKAWSGSSTGRTPLECYEIAASKNLPAAYERLYFVYQNGELGQKKDEEKANFYKFSYRSANSKNIANEKFIPLRLNDLIKKQKIVEGLSKLSGTQHKQGETLTSPRTPRKETSTPRERKPSLPPQVLQELGNRNKHLNKSSSSKEKDQKHEKCSIQ